MITRLRNKFALSHILPILLLMPLLSLYLLYSLEDFFTKNLLQQLDYQARLLTDRVERDPQVLASPDAASAFLGDIAALTDARVLLLANNGTMLGSTRLEDQRRVGTRLEYSYLAQAASGNVTQGIGPGLLDEVAYVVLPVHAGDTVVGLLRVSYSLSDLRAQINQLQILILGGTLFTALLGLVLALALATTITRPLDTLAHSAELIARGNYAVRASVQGRDEVALLAQSFNQMATRLAELERTRRRQLAAITHELARPLTGMRAAIETLYEGAHADQEVRESLLEGVLGELSRMQRLVEALQRLQKRTLRTMTLNSEEVALDRVIRASVGNYEALAARSHITLGLELPPDLPRVRADQDRIIQVLTNLLDNAFKFTPPDGEITVRASQVDSSVAVTVADTGVGITPEEQPNLFQEFFQGGTAHPSEKQGMGLGLMISREIISAHGGTISVASQPGQGSQVTFTLPQVVPLGKL